MSLRLVAENLNQIRVIIAVETCSKAIFKLYLRHGKSPCFSQVAFLQLVGPDYPLLILPYVDGAENMECAS
jgi:hypothetical protein